MSNESKSSNVYVSERLQNPAALMPTVKKENFTWAAILACISALLFVALLFLMWMDHTELLRAF